MTEFEKYVKSDFGVNSTTLYDYKNSMTPMVIEESAILKAAKLHWS